MRKTTLNQLGLIIAVALVGAFAAAPTAVAQDPSNDPSSAQYDPPNIEEGAEGAEGTGAAGASGSGGSGGDDSGLSATIGSLPFTGMDLLIVGGVALMLTASGFALRRLSTPRDPTS